MANLTPWTQPLMTLPGITTPQIEEKLRHAMKEFYLESRAWRRTLGPLDITQVGAGVIALDPIDVNTRVAWVRGAWLQEGTVRTHLSPMAAPWTEVRTDKPTHFWIDPPSTLHLWPTPGQDYLQTLHVEVALTVSDAATVFPDLSASHHFEAILNGAYARLHAMPNKPWTDIIVAARYAQLFRRACIQLRAVSDAGHQHADPPWRFPPFA